METFLAFFYDERLFCHEEENKSDISFANYISFTKTKCVGVSHLLLSSLVVIYHQWRALEMQLIKSMT